MKFLFFFLGVPMMIMSFLQTVDALPYVQSADLLVDGKEIVLTEDEQAKLQQEVSDLFEGSLTMPAFGVMFDDMFQQATQSGTFVSLKFGRVLEVNGLPFDQLVFQVSPDWSGFNLFRGMNGVFQGRCIYIDLNGKTMQEFSDFINTLPALQDVDTQIPESEVETPAEDVVEQSNETENTFQPENASNVQTDFEKNNQPEIEE